MSRHLNYSRTTLELYYSQDAEKLLQEYLGLGMAQFQVSGPLAKAYGAAETLSNAINRFIKYGI